MSDEGWIGVDLDGTLAMYNGWHGYEYIGEPIPLMMERVKHWIEEGRIVKIFTARITDEEARIPIQTWLDKHGIGQLEITNVKDFKMIQLWDDRCIQVMPNMGIAMYEHYGEVVTENLDLNKKNRDLKEHIEKLKIKIGDMRKYK